MTHLETELSILKSSLIEMWGLVISQIEKSKQVIAKADKETYAEVKANEKLVDAYELKIDMDCENILALLNPLAGDLRFVLASLKINYNLERIGDFARGIALTFKENDFKLSSEAMKDTQILSMFDVCVSMLNEALEAFEKQDNIKARSVILKDDILDDLNKKSTKILVQLIEKNNKKIEETLNLQSAIKKLERIGDHTKNISEEIIFYIEALVLKHKKKKEISGLK